MKTIRKPIELTEEQLKELSGYIAEVYTKGGDFVIKICYHNKSSAESHCRKFLTGKW